MGTQSHRFGHVGARCPSYRGGREGFTVGIYYRTHECRSTQRTLPTIVLATETRLKNRLTHEPFQVMLTGRKS